MMKTVERHQHRQENGHVLMRSECEEGFLRAVAGRAQAVRSEADPGEKRNQRKLMEDLGILDVARGPNQDLADRALFGARRPFVDRALFRADRAVVQRLLFSAGRLLTVF